MSPQDLLTNPLPELSAPPLPKSATEKPRSEPPSDEPEVPQDPQDPEERSPLVLAFVMFFLWAPLVCMGAVGFFVLAMMALGRG